MTSGPWNQEPDGLVTIDHLIETYGAVHIATSLGLAERTIYRWRNQRRTFTLAQATEIARCLDEHVGTLWPELEPNPLEPQPVDWREHANCIGIATGLFYPTRDEDAPEVYRMLRPICWACSVRKECLDEALYYEQNGAPVYGMQGGTTPRERVFLRKVRRDYRDLVRA